MEQQQHQNGHKDPTIKVWLYTTHLPKTYHKARSNAAENEEDDNNNKIESGRVCSYRNYAMLPTTVPDGERPLWKPPSELPYGRSGQGMTDAAVARLVGRLSNLSIRSTLLLWAGDAKGQLARHHRRLLLSRRYIVLCRSGNVLALLREYSTTSGMSTLLEAAPAQTYLRQLPMVAEKGHRCCGTRCSEPCNAMPRPMLHCYSSAIVSSMHRAVAPSHHCSITLPH
ncbi:hypothetical protein LSAT2_025594, partial [Lamellibrachia satsuma]